MSVDASIPVFLLGGQDATVSVARSLARLGIRVSLSGDLHCWALFSKYLSAAYPVPTDQVHADYWRRLLLSPGVPELEGNVILALNDVAIEFVLEHEAELRKKYLLELFDRDLRIAMLDKLHTLELARRVGVPAPMHWQISSLADIHSMRDQFKYPVMVKPLHSHLLIHSIGEKLFIIESSFEELLEKAGLVLDLGIDLMIVEMIPGPDSLLSSYYTFMDKEGQHLLEYTKRVLRRFPKNSGGAVMHESIWLPETAVMGKKFFEGIGWRGLGNIEFKYDTRDGQLKIIEVNARVTGAHALLDRCGMPIAQFAYTQAAGLPAPKPQNKNEGLRLWYPLRDFRAFLELNRSGELSLFEWINSLFERPLMLSLPVFDDPKPRLKATGYLVSQNVIRIWNKIFPSRHVIAQNFMVPIGELDEKTWSKIDELADCPMQTGDWLLAASEAGFEGNAVALFSDTLASPRSMAAFRAMPGKRLRLLGAIDMGESVRVVSRDEGDLADIADKMSSLNSIVELGHYPATPDFCSILRQQSRMRGVVLARKNENRAMPVLALDASWRDIDQHLSRNRRQSMRRKLRKAQQIGEVEFLIICPKSHEVSEWFERFVDVEAKSWKSRTKTALAQDLKQAAFFRSYAHRMAEQGALRLCFMKIDSHYAAAQFAVVWQNAFWSIKVGYDEHYKAVSPGDLLTRELIRKSAEHGFERFEFCGKEGEWTRRWTERADEILALRFYPYTIRGLAALLQDAFDQLMRKLTS